MPVFLTFFFLGLGVANAVAFLCTGNPLLVATEILSVGLAFYYAFFHNGGALS